MPQMGVSVAEGTILEWRKRPGDWVEADETVCDVTTDKVDVEIPSPATGRLSKILAEPGTTLAGGRGDGGDRHRSSAGEAHPDEGQAGVAEGGSPAADRSRRGAGRRHRIGTDAPLVSPVVRRIADKHGVDLAQVEGTGVGGRVQEGRARVHRERRRGRGAEDEEPKPQKTLHMESPYRPDEPEAPPKPSRRSRLPATGAEAASSCWGRREPMSPMRQAIAKHMVASRQTAAHCTTIVEVDFAGRRPPAPSSRSR